MSTTAALTTKRQSQILEALQSTTLGVQDVADKFSVGKTTARKDLDALTNAGSITTTKVGGKTVWGTTESIVALVEPGSGKNTNGTKAKAAKTSSATREETTRRDVIALEFIAKAGDDGVTRDQVAQELGVTGSLAYLSIWRLVHNGQIAKKATGNRTPTYTVVRGA